MDSTYRRESSAGYLTNWAARLLTRTLERRLAGGGAGSMPVYFSLIDGEAYTQKQLAHWAAVEQPTMANTLNRMQRDGEILRTPDPADRRSALISLTPLGRTHAKAALKAAVDVNEFALSVFSPAERAQFLAFLKRMIGKLDADG